MSVCVSVRERAGYGEILRELECCQCDVVAVVVMVVAGVVELSCVRNSYVQYVQVNAP